jgi:hydroxyacylglutathione hydrolase
VLEVLTVETPSLGDRSYVATDGRHAVVVDPQRDLDRVLARTEPRGLTITHVLETHVHNDYLTGGLALAREVGADYCLHADDPVRYDRRGLRDGDLLVSGDLRVRAVATPGHTFTHLAYVLEGGGRTVVFSGGSLLHGSTGRTDLLGDEHTAALARHQHASVRRLAGMVSADSELFPTHGFGSFCASAPAATEGRTVGDQVAVNPALVLDEEPFVAQLLGGLGAFPAYYAHMAARNLAGPAAPDLGPVTRADPTELRRRLAAGEWVVDLRTRTAFAAEHLPGSVNVGLDGAFATWVGWLVPRGAAVTLLGATAEQVAEGQRELVRIGIDRPAAAASGSPRAWAGGAPVRGYPVLGFGDLAVRMRHGEPPYVLDVRLAEEHRDGRVAGSTNIPLPQLHDRLDEVPDDREVWVHCGVGYRAGIAASLLRREGFVVVLVDGEFSDAGAAGVPLAA